MPPKLLRNKVHQPLFHFLTCVHLIIVVNQYLLHSVVSFKFFQIMYRKRNGSLGFSFTRFANAAVPNFFEEPAVTSLHSLIPLRRDMLYAHQIASANPYNFDERSVFVAGVVESEAVSRKTFKALQKCNVLGPEGEIDTTQIGNRFTHQVAILNAYRQRELINMLFWWEEEVQRLKKLKAEEQDLNAMIKESRKLVDEDEVNGESEDRRPDSGEEVMQKQMLDQLKFARERVRMKIRQRPSERRPDVEANTDDIADAYLGRSKSAPTPNGAVQVEKPSGQPPQYYR